MVEGSKPHVQQVVVGAVIFNKSGKALIVRRPESEEILPGFFELPSGKKEIGEDTESALRREVKEETGLIFKEARPFSVFDYDVEKPDFIRETTQINFMVLLGDENPDIALSEHDEYRWVGGSELAVVKLSDKTRQTMETAFGLLNKS